MCRDPVEPFEHFEVIDPKSAQLKEMLRERRRPNTVRMEYRAGPARGSGTMKQCLCTALWLVDWSNFAKFIDNHEIIWAQMAFVLAAGCDQQPQWVAIDDDAVVAGGSE